MKSEGKTIRYCMWIFCVFNLFALVQSTFSQEKQEDADFFVGHFKKIALTIAVPDVGPIIGATDLEVRHPFWVSARPIKKPPKDPTNPANIAEAWVIEIFTNMQDRNGKVIVGATLRQEWVGVSIEEAISFGKDGFSVLISSGGFMFALTKQVASPEATAAFGLRTIDNGKFIQTKDTVQGICG